MSASNAIIEVKDLTKTFGEKTVVDQLTMDIQPGQLYAFLGPNGSGKTTAIRMMCGLIPPTSGGGVCAGFDIATQADQIKPLLGYMTQHFSLYPDLTVRENLEFVCRLYGVSDVKGRVNDLIEQFAFHDLGRDKQQVGTLSGGWKQRMALACAVSHRPKLLLLDEPTAGVDPKAREAFWDILQEVTASGVSALVSTHYMDEAMRSNRLAYMLYGRLLVDDKPENVLRNCALVSVQVDLLKAVDLVAVGRDPRVVRMARLGNSVRVVARSQDDVDGWIKDRLGDAAGHTTEIDVGLEDIFFHLTLQQQGTNTSF
ncbi:ABC transporter ATP-binding protein [Aquabacterium lacunae]|uniref:ABC transporter ATP-binding protein n=1 Tax=Aquabacterium lacunae TaxID=2528630 RepID=A0A4Q9H3P7_9BURK|nr:ABC transporter ATP-binding protein [Aquabacterium lacunae]TBO29339.1 ABC transporter ATP-binding protein [Aquabacterium lacunae]